MDDERYDFYEITFSAEGDMEAALAIFEQVENIDGVTGACFSGGDVSDKHPFSRTDVARAAAAIEKEIDGRSGGDAWLYGIDEEVRVEMLRALANVALVAATNPSLPLPRNDQTNTETPNA